MALLQWTEQLSVGVDTFDDHHKQMISLLNELHDAMTEGRGSEALSRVLGELIDYTDYHFSAEEEAFDKFGYPEADAHKKAHADLLEKARDLKSQFDSGDTLMSMDVAEFLKRWVTEHIKGDDQKYSDFFADKPIE